MENRMSKLDAVMAHHDSVWHGVARYSVYRSTWSPTKTHETLATGLPYDKALANAAEKQKAVGGVTFGGVYFGVQLENTEEARAAVRAANIWDALAQP
jgi:hypothetical protein